MEQAENGGSTECGVTFGGGGENGFNPYSNFNIDYSSSNTTISTTTIIYQIETEARDLGNIDLQYYDNNSIISEHKNCSSRSGHR